MTLTPIAVAGNRQPGSGGARRARSEADTTPGMTIDPQARWAETGKPAYAGLVTFGGLPYTERADELAEVDVAILGAPFDELVSDRPGTRLGPRAIRAASGWSGPHLDLGVDPAAVLRVVDFGDAPVVPADVTASHAAIERTVTEVLAAGAMPLVLGGDHSIAEPDVRACAARHGPVGLIQFDAHTDTAAELFGTSRSHGTPMYRLVEQGHVAPDRYVQIGLRGYWPGEEEFAWQRERGITAFSMQVTREQGIRDIVERAIDTVSTGPVFLSVDVDVLDPAFAPGTGTPEPGGMMSADLLWACRELASRLELAGAEIVEVAPVATELHDITALVASRVAWEILTGLAVAAGRE
jgi:agmatinase